VFFFFFFFQKNQFNFRNNSAISSQSIYVPQKMQQ